MKVFYIVVLETEFIYKGEKNLYFVDRKLLERRLLYLEGLLNEMQNHPFNTFIEKLAMERIVHMSIESMLDCGNMIIDGYIMRDPGSFEDIIDILVDEKVLPAEESDNYKTVVQLRNMLIKHYMDVDHTHLKLVIEENYRSMELFSSRIRAFLDEETNVANAFTND